MVKMVGWLAGSIVFTFMLLAILWKISTIIAVVLATFIFLFPVGAYINSRLRKSLKDLSHEQTATTRNRWDS